MYDPLADKTLALLLAIVNIVIAVTMVTVLIDLVSDIFGSD